MGEEGEYSWLRGEGPRNEIHIAYVQYFIITTLETYLQWMYSAADHGEYFSAVLEVFQGMFSHYGDDENRGNNLP